MPRCRGKRHDQPYAANAVGLQDAEETSAGFPRPPPGGRVGTKRLVLSATARIPVMDNRQKDLLETDYLGFKAVKDRAMPARKHSRDEVITVQLQASGTHQLVMPDQMNASLAMRVGASKGSSDVPVVGSTRWGSTRCVSKYNFTTRARSPCFLIDAAADQNPNELPLIPDFYCLASEGYVAIRNNFQELPRWENRLPIAIWRGSSTGTDLTPVTLQTLKRYRRAKTL